jgi:hypothetical protein
MDWAPGPSHLESSSSSGFSQPPTHANAAFPFNQSVEGDFWGYAQEPTYSDANATGVEDLALGASFPNASSSPILADTNMGTIAGSNTNSVQADELFFSTDQAQASQHKLRSAPNSFGNTTNLDPPSLADSTFEIPGTGSAIIMSAAGAGTSGPPSQLFAAPHFSPFMHAQFEVENDLNAVNPIVPLRNFTGDSSRMTSNTNNPLTPLIPQQQPHIGHLAPQPSHSPMQNQYDSLIDTEEEARLNSQNSNQAHSRKRARGGNAQPQPATVTQQQNHDDESHSSLYLHPTGQQHQLASAPRVSAVRSPHVPLSVSPHIQSLSSGASQDSHDSPDSASNPLEREDAKKVKHQLTDRQRRAKIKESMDQLKALVPLEANQKADQATIVASSVQLVQNLKDEVQQLKMKLQQLEISHEHEARKAEERKIMLSRMPGHQPPLLSNSPFTSMMASLNGAGVAMWRIGLTGKIIEVNLVFELVSGFSAREIVGNSPCGPPLFGSLSIMPAAFLKAFSQVSALAPVADPTIETNNHNNSSSSSNSSSASDRSPNSPQQDAPYSPHSSASTHSHVSSPTATTTDASPLLKAEDTAGLSQALASAGADSSAGQGGSVAPLYANASISSFPVVPQAQLENFFPVRSKQHT